MSDPADGTRDDESDADAGAVATAGRLVRKLVAGLRGFHRGHADVDRLQRADDDE